MIRVVLPAHLRALAGIDGEVELAVSGPVTQCSVLNALEARYPMLAGTIRAEIDVAAVANHIIGGLEGAMLISRIERNDQALRQALEHLDSYVDVQVRKSHSQANRKH